MKYNWIIITLLLCASCTTDTPTNRPVEKETAQLETIKVDDGEKVYNIVDEMPRLTGCGDAFDKKACSEKELLSYLYANVEYDSVAIVNGDLETSIVFSFVVEKDGTVSNIEFLKGTEANWNVRSMLESMPLWIPGKLRGVPKRVKKHVPLRVRFDLD